MLNAQLGRGCILACSISLWSGAVNAPKDLASAAVPEITFQERLERGEVVVGLKDVGTTKFVTGSMLINEPPDRVWPIMVNPYEFLGKISPRMKNVEVVTDRANLSVLKVTLDVTLIPHFTYIVESRYENSARIEFKRIGGVLKDFRGYWEMSPAGNGSRTQLTYSMYIDPGFPVPQWIIREGVKAELPRTLLALRKRVGAVCEKSAALEPHTILAAAVNHPVGNHPHLPAIDGATE
jgi:Polyketide cyclase / dehydrase and lipid transport